MYNTLTMIYPMTMFTTTMKGVSVYNICILLWVITGTLADLPCLPLRMSDSVVCVCNGEYCDTVTREAPQPGYYVTYTSSKSGSRFRKHVGVIEPRIPTEYGYNYYDQVLRLDTYKKYQVIEGFGGAVTDAAGINWKSLHPKLQQQMIRSYCSEDGLEYSMLRIPNGSADFSTRAWAYNEFPINDAQLTNFTFSSEDINYKIPMIQACQKAATAEVKFISSTWTTPSWMLDVDQRGVKWLKKEFYRTFAEYNCKFAELYQTQGIKMWGISGANEPQIPLMAGVKNETIIWSTPDMGEFIAKHFGPVIRNCSVRDMKILGVDDQRFTVPLYFNELKAKNPDAIQYIDGVAVHYYIDEDTSPAVIPRALRKYPDKFVISTEACVKIFEDRGSWKYAKVYLKDILENLNYNLVGWLDWNLCLDKEGGPNYLKTFVDSPVIVDAGKQEFFKQPMYYALGHFSKFIPRGSQRIRVVKTAGRFCVHNLDLQEVEAIGQELFDNVAFVTPRGTIVVVIHNEGPQQNISIQLDDGQISILVEEESVTTVELPYQE